jgi:hypothetical protein
LDGATRPVKKLHAQLLFKRHNLLGYAGLRGIQRLGRIAKAADHHDGQKCLHMGDLHAAPLPNIPD